MLTKKGKTRVKTKHLLSESIGAWCRNGVRRFPAPWKELCEEQTFMARSGRPDKGYDQLISA